MGNESRGRGRRRAWVVLLCALMVIEAGAVSPASVAADEQSPSPSPIESPSAQPEPSAQPSPQATSFPSPAPSPTEAVPSPSPEPSPSTSAEPPPGSEPTPSPSPEATATPGSEEPFELTDLRTAASQTFQQPDGTLVTDFYGAPIFYQPEGSTEWLPIDLRFSPVTGGAVNARADKNRSQVALGAADDASGFLNLVGGGHAIGFRLPNGVSPGRPGTRATISDDGLFAEYADFLPGGIGLRVFPQIDGVKSFLVLPRDPAMRPFRFAVDAPGLTLTKDDDGSIGFHDAAGALVARMPRPYMVDSSINPEFGSGRFSADVRLEVSTNGGQTIISIYPDQAFLNTAVYPVYLDPSVANFNAANDSVRDTFVWSKYTTMNFDTWQRPDAPYYHEMFLGREPGTSNDTEILIKFPGVETTLAGAVIESADLKFYPYHQWYPSTPKTTWVQRVTGDWEANTVKWSTKPTSTNNLNPADLDTTKGVWASFDVKSYVQALVDGNQVNKGFRLWENNNGETFWKRIVASEDSSSYKPYLRVEWHLPTPLVADDTGSNPYAYRSGTKVYFNSSQEGSFTLTASSPGVAGVDSYRYGALSGTPTGWSASAKTRLYLLNTTPDVSPSYASAWDDTSYAARRNMGTTRALSSHLSTMTGTGTAGQDVLSRQFVSPPMAAQVICGTIKGQVIARQVSADTQARPQLMARVVNAAGGGSRTLKAVAGGTNYQFYVAGSTFENRKFPYGGESTLNCVAVDDGDRLVVEIGFRNHGTNSTSEVRLRYSASSNTGNLDLPEDQTSRYSDSSDHPYAWVEFSSVLLSANTGVLYTDTDGKRSFAWSSGAATTSVAVKAIAADGVQGDDTTISFTRDQSPPTRSFNAPTGSWNDPPASEPELRSTTAYTVDFTSADNTGGSGVATNGVTLTRQRGTIVTPGSCAGVAWGPDGTWTRSGGAQVDQTLTSGNCYRWQLVASDKVSNTSGTLTSSTVLVDTSAPTSSVSNTAYSNSRTVSTSWTASDSQSGLMNTTVYWSPNSTPGSSDTACGSAQTGSSGTINCTVNADGTFWFGSRGRNNADLLEALAYNTSIVVDTVAPTFNGFTAPPSNPTYLSSTSYAFSWNAASDASPSSGGLTYERTSQSATVSSPGVCSGTWTNLTAFGFAAVTSTTQGSLSSGTCYRMAVRVRDNALKYSAWYYSNPVLVDPNAPGVTFTVPAVGTTPYINVTSYQVTWSETSSSGIASRSLQRQRVALTNGAPGTSWANDGSASTALSPVTVTGLLSGYCYRWTQTLTSGAGLSASATSGVACVDTGAPNGTISYPEQGRALAGTVAITGTASDALTASTYDLHYGVGGAPATWTTIALSQPGPISGGSLATWATQALQGTYTLRLTVRDAAGNTATATRTVYLENSRRGDDSYRTRVPFDLGGGWRMSVGVANGELTLDRGLFEIPSFGPPQSLALSYSSKNLSTAGQLGTGWSSNLTQFLSFEDGFVVWHSADGGLVPFGQIAGTWTPLAGHFETLAYDSGVNRYTVTQKDQTKVVFEGTGAGRLLRVENRFGKSLTLAWNTSSATATDASGRATTLTISGGKVTAATDSAGRAWSFAYSGDNLTGVTDPAGASTTLAYGSSGLTSITRSRSRVSGAPETITWSVTYASGKVSGVKDPINSSVANTFTYGTNSTTVGLLKTYSPLVRNTWIYSYDHLGRVTSVLDPAGYTTTYAFDAASNLTQIVLPIEIGPPAVGQTIGYTYDGRGNVLTETTQLTATQNVITTMSWNATSDLLTRSEADNDAAIKTVTRYTYHVAGHLTGANVNCTSSGTTPPATAATCTGAGTQNASTNLITTFTYTANDQLETETDALGRVSKHVFDSHGNEIETIANFVAGASATHERNVSTTTAYNAAGLPTSANDPLGNETTYAYDALGQQLTEELPGDSSIPALTRTTAYDEFGNALSETESWADVSRTTTYVYDKTNRQTKMTDPAGVESTTAYDAAGDAVVSISGGTTTSLTFDGLGRVTSESVGDATTTHSYDGAGRELETVDPEGVTTVRTYDRAGRPLSETVDPAGSSLTTSYSYDALGRQISSTAPDGVITTSSYDRAGHLTATTEAGATMSYTYDRAGNETSTTAPDGTLTTTQYDALNRATIVTANDVANPSLPTEDVTTRTWYDAASRTVAFTDAAGVSSRSIYNVRGLVKLSISNCTDSGTTPTLDPPNCVGAGTHNDKTNIVTTTDYDGSGSVIVAVVAVGRDAEATIEYAYDAAGRQRAVKDPVQPRGTVTRTIYDTDGRVTSTIANCTEDTSDPEPPDPNGSWWSCDGSTLEDGSWNVTSSRTYDAHGNVASETAPNGRRTEYLYDDADRLFQRIDNAVSGTPAADENISTLYAYDDAGRQSAVLSPTADRDTFTVSRYVYDAQGHLTAEIRNCTASGTTPPGDPAWKACSGDGTKDASTNLITQYGYDDRGNRVSVTAADPSATVGTSTDNVTTRYAFDEQNRLCGVLENATVNLAWPDPCASPGSGSDSENVWTRYTYDGLGNLASMIDAVGHTTAYGYDESSRMITLTDADGNTTTYAYDDLGRRTGQRERGTGSMPTLVSWTYDAAGRMLTRTTDDGTTSYEYDVNGNRTSTELGDSVITATYDRLNRPLTVTVDGDEDATTSYTYSLTSPSWSDPSGAYSSTLDAFDRQISVTDPIHSEPWTFAYRADGQPASSSAPSGTTTAFAYDPAANLADKTTMRTADSATIADYAWTRNRSGNILSEASAIDGDPTNGTTAYAYDQLGRLISYDRGGSTTAYGWQAVPNRISVQIGADPAVTTAYDPANRPTLDSVGGSYASDDEGRLVARPGQTLEWDDLGRLTAVRDADTNDLIAAYSYDAIDRLLTVARAGSATIRFRYVGLTTQVAQEVHHDAPSSVIRSIANDWTGTRLLDWTDAGTDARFYGTNAHDDVTWTADDAGAVSATLRYDPWGNTVASTGSSLTNFRFQSSWFDPSTELYWVVARWYAPSLGRFISEDMLLGQATEPPSRHLYAYALGQPISLVDVLGLCSATAVSRLDCTISDFDAMSASTRRLWLKKFQQLYAPNWWNAILGVLDGSRDKGAIVPGRSWFSRVDAYILAAIQDGQRAFQQLRPLHPKDPAVSWWLSFFYLRQKGSDEATLRYYWGRAEQAATDYGVKMTVRRPTLREWSVKGTTDLWRFAVANGDGISNALDRSWCYLIAICRPIPALYKLARDPVLNPKTSPGTISFIFDVMWDFWGSFYAPACATVHTWWGEARSLCK